MPQTARREFEDRVAAVSADLAGTRPELNRWAVAEGLRAFLNPEADLSRPPAPAELRARLGAAIEARGRDAAFRDFGFFQIGAARLWGAAETAHFARILREARVAEKPERRTEWERAEGAVRRLPPEWRELMTAHLDRSREGGGRRGRGDVWSASRLKAVADALARWRTFCDATGTASLPTGVSLDAYARHLVQRGVSESSAGDYIERIRSGFAAVLRPGWSSDACVFVVEDWRQRGAAAGSRAKSGAQLVSAKVLYDLGFDLMDEARALPTRGLAAALTFRSGVLLSTAAALPQRARALSVLAFGSTLHLLERPDILIRIPGRFLKLRETEKARETFERRLRNPRLWEALDEYRRRFRPLFDEGEALFPSVHAPGQAVSERRIGQIAGEVTMKRLGVRIPIHRFRDNVATEASETMPDGGRLAPSLLGHRDAATAVRHYDHSEGMAAAQGFARVLARRRTRRTDLRL